MFQMVKQTIINVLLILVPTIFSLTQTNNNHLAKLPLPIQDDIGTTHIQPILHRNKRKILKNPVKSLENASGIFFENLGTAKLSTSTWTLLSHTNISFFEEKFELIQNGLQTIREICNQLSTGTHPHTCDQTIEQNEGLLAILKDKFDALTHLTGYKLQDMFQSKRRKRGLIDAGSTVLKWIIGTPDANDAAFYHDSIIKAQSDEKFIQILMKQQLQLVKNTITNFNESVTSLHQNEQLLNMWIITLQQHYNQTRSSQEELLKGQLINGHLSLLGQMANQLNEDLNNLIHAVLFAKKNIIHPAIITPHNLLNELVHAVTPAGTEIPVSTDFHSIFQYLNL